MTENTNEELMYDTPDDSVIVRNARLAVELELKKKEALGLPIAKYDPKTEKAYLVYADGRREEVKAEN
ncbi:MAG: hypothetical protein LUE12_02685 [Ruminococcus sp.]|nr:hypothetical protein [Ruminococcus sp.]